MFKRYGTILGIGFFFLAGMLMGGCFIAALPHHNHIQLMVTPYNAINVIPEVGDIIDWSTYGQTAPTPVSFPVTGSPCSPSTPTSRCIYQDPGQNNVSIYQCSGSIPCDPGIGPHSVTGTNVKSNILEMFVVRLGLILDVFVAPIDRFFDVLPGTPGIAPSPVSSPLSTPPVVPALATGEPDVTIGCLNNQTYASPQDIPKASQDMINWAGPAFTIAFSDTSACQGNMSSPAPFQSCKFTPPAGTPSKTKFPYTVTDSSCAGQTYSATITTP